MYLVIMSHTQIIDSWPTLSDFAADIGVKYGTAKAMKMRGSIPARYWPRLVAKASSRKIRGVTLSVLAAALKESA